MFFSRQKCGQEFKNEILICSVELGYGPSRNYWKSAVGNEREPRLVNPGTSTFRRFSL
jgi:hypothetical protein